MSLKPLPGGCYSGCMWRVYQCFLLSTRHIIGIDKRVKGCFQQTRGFKFKIFIYKTKTHAMRSNNLTLCPIAETRGHEHRYLIYTTWCIPHCGQANIEAGSQALVAPTELTRSMIICVFYIAEMDKVDNNSCFIRLKSI